MSVKVLDVVKPGVVLGKDIQKLFAVARENEFALPAVNVVGTNSVNAVLETAAKLNSPVMIQFSSGGAQFFAGKGLNNDNHAAVFRKFTKLFRGAPCKHRYGRQNQGLVDGMLAA